MDKRGALKRLALIPIALLLPLPFWMASVGRDGALPAVLLAVGVLACLALPTVLGLALRPFLPAAKAWMLAVGGHLLGGALYAALRPAGEVPHLLPKVLLWPMLLYWQDLCRVGLWSCPSG